MNGIGNLLDQFADILFNIEFLWIVVAVTITMEVLKWTVPYFKNANSKLYPLWVLIICVIWTFLKAVIIAESFKEWVANFIFTAILADFIYTYVGSYIIMAIVSIFKLKVKVEKSSIETTIETKETGEQKITTVEEVMPPEYKP
jgi:hypothetical protein